MLDPVYWFDVRRYIHRPEIGIFEVNVKVLMDSVLSLLWRQNGHDGVSNHQPHDCLLNRPCRRRSKKTSKLRVTGLCMGNSPGTGEFPAQMASNAENVSIWWRHHVIILSLMMPMLAWFICMTNYTEVHQNLAAIPMGTIYTTSWIWNWHAINCHMIRINVSLRPIVHHHSTYLQPTWFSWESPSWWKHHTHVAYSLSGVR